MTQDKPDSSCAFQRGNSVPETHLAQFWDSLGDLKKNREWGEKEKKSAPVRQCASVISMAKDGFKLSALAHWM